MSKKNQRQNEKPSPELQVTSPAEWRKFDEDGDLVELPSGNVVRCKRPGMAGFVDLGMVPNDLLPLVDKHVEGYKPPTIETILEDTGLLETTANFTDAVFLYCVTEPEVLPAPEDVVDPETKELLPAKRERDVLYIDDVEVEDRLFVLQFAMGGTRSVRRFRELQVTTLADQATEQGAKDETQRAG